MNSSTGIPPAPTQTIARPGFVLLPLIALLPAFLGGATQRWSQGLVLLLLGIVLAARPPRVSLGRAIEGVLIALLACAATAFLPAAWLGVPSWRQVATHDLGLNLGPLITPQPWLTLESLIIFAGGLCWLYYVCAEALGSGHPIQRASKRRPRPLVSTGSTHRQNLSFFCAGIGLFAAISLFLYFTKTPWPFRDAHYLFGPFPNRNQTGNLLAIGAILLIARVGDDFRHRRKTWILWTCIAALVLIALVLAFSRAAIVLFFGAVIAWIACLASIRNSGMRLAVGAGIVLFLWSAFLFGGGDTLNRFLPASLGGNEMALAHDLRWDIQKDALVLGQASPFTGIGLGNFESQFWLFHRSLGTTNYRVLHPESDWIWMRVEMGWLSVLLGFTGCTLLAARALPLGKDPAWRLRAAAAAAMLLFAMHGAVDVSAHRMGTAFPAIFVGSLAILPGRGILLAGRWMQTVFRAAGIVFCGVGALWLIAGLADLPIPGQIGIDLLKKQALQFNKEGAYTRALPLAITALQWAPMDWELHHAKAIATALATNDFKAALTDFRRARYLNPITPEIPFNEGAMWLLQRPALTISAWQEALKRAGENRAPLFQTMVGAAAGNAQVLAGLKERAQGEPDLTLILLEQANPREFQNVLATLLHADPELYSFSPLQKQTLFKLWAGQPESAQFLPKVESRENWLLQAWPYVAGFHASKGEYQRACEVARRFIPAPTLPQVIIPEPVARLQRDLYLNPENFTKGYALYDQQVRQGNSDDALATLQKLTARSQCPAYFFSLEATQQIQRKKWREAWEALNRGGFLIPPKPTL